MPELPEVETTVRGLKFIISLSIKEIKLNRHNLRYPIQKNIPKITKNSKIKSIYRKAKYIIIQLNNSFSLIIHLGMSGRLIMSDSSEKIRNKIHDHVEIILNNGKKIIFNDPRRFGIFDITKSCEINNHKYLYNLGPDPFSKNFNSNYFFSKIKKSSSTIKSILLNQSIISGIGNIYASEILFLSRISPLKKANKLTKYDIEIIIKSIKRVLIFAIKNKGSTLKDFRDVDGTLGNYQNKFKVYGKENSYIKVKNRNIKIIKIFQNGRSTYYCPAIQK